MDDRKVVYIIGPYRALTPNEIIHNIAEAYGWMEWCWRRNYIPICPHMNSALTDGLIPDHGIMDGCIEILTRCDAVLLTGGWEDSTGSVAELEIAKDRGLEIIDPYNMILDERN